MFSCTPAAFSMWPAGLDSRRSWWSVFAQRALARRWRPPGTNLHGGRAQSRPRRLSGAAGERVSARSRPRCRCSNLVPPLLRGQRPARWPRSIDMLWWAQRLLSARYRRSIESTAGKTSSRHAARLDGISARLALCHSGGGTQNKGRGPAGCRGALLFEVLCVCMCCCV